MTTYVQTKTESKRTSTTETSVESAMNAPENERGGMETATAKDETVLTEKEKQKKKDAEEDMNYPHGMKLFIILGALCLAVFLVALDQTIISTAIPKITDHFNSIQDIGWVSFLCCGCFR